MPMIMQIKTIFLIHEERKKQDQMWGDTHDEDHLDIEWVDILDDLVKKAKAQVGQGHYSNANDAFQAALVKIAATSVAAIEGRQRSVEKHGSLR